MIRFSLFLAFFSVIISLSAQDVESVFIDKVTLESYDKQVKKLGNSINVLSENRVDLNAKKQLRHSVDMIRRNSLSIYNKMETFVDAKKLAPLKERQFTEGGLDETALDFRNRNMREKNSDRYQELLMTQEDVNMFLDNMGQIKNIDDELKHIDYRLTKDSQSTATQLAQLSDLAQKNKQLLKSKYN